MLMILPVGDKFAIMKPVSFGQNKVNLSIIMKLCYGQAKQIECGKFYRQRLAAVNYMHDRGGAYQAK